MQVFISYSTGDLDAVKRIANFVRDIGDVKYWDKDKEPGETAWDTIFEWIEDSDLVIALITDKTVSRAMSVGQEIGHAKAKGKKIIPIVTSNVRSSSLGCLMGITYIPVDRKNMLPAMFKIRETMKKEKFNNLVDDTLIVGGILGLLWAGSKLIKTGN